MNPSPPRGIPGRAWCSLAASLLLLALQSPLSAQYQISAGAFNDLTPVSPFAPVPGTDGLTGEYYNSMDLSGPVVLTRTDAALNFNWAGSPGAGVNADQFSVRWTGFISVPTAGAYTFYPTSDDGVRLWINGVLVVNAWRDQGATEYSSGAINLSGGQVPVKVEFYDNAVAADVVLRWEGPGIAKGVIPSTNLLPGAQIDPPVTRPAIPGQTQGPNTQSVAAISSASGAKSPTAPLGNQFPSAIYRDGSGTPTGKVTVMLQSELGYTFASGVPKYFMGDVISTPLTRADGVTPAAASYWRAKPVQPGEVISHTTGSPETPITAGTPVGYYYSPHAQRVFASQPGFVVIKWVSRLPESGRYKFKDEIFSVSTSTRAVVKPMYWTEGSFNGPGIALPPGRITAINPIYSPFFPATVANAYVPPGTAPDPNGIPPEHRTMWLSQGTNRSLRAYNFEGRIFVEYLGALNPGGVTYEFLGADIVDVSRAAPPETVTVKLGEQLLPQDRDQGLIPSPVTPESTNSLYGSTTRGDGRVVYYAERESLDPDKVQFYWMEPRDAAIYVDVIPPGIDLKWPKFLNKYRQVWPTEPADFAQVVLPDDGSSVETGVSFANGSIPQIVWQDDVSLTEAAIDQNSQRLLIHPGFDGNNRSLLKFISGTEVWYVRLNSQTQPGVADGGRDGTSFTAAATVGRRIERPSAAYELGGYISAGKGYNPAAYRNPYSVGVESSGSGAIIPVNAVPGDTVMKVWWFKKVNPPSDKFAPFHVASRLGIYTVGYPAQPQKIILASNDGSGDLSPAQVAGSLYIQNDRTKTGFNPNEEHAMLISGRVYALRDDLNLLGSSAAAYTSAPFALLAHTSVVDGRPDMTVFKIEREDAAHHFDYPVTAGTILQGPMPLPILPPAVENGVVKNKEVTPSGIDDAPDRTGPVAVYDKFTFKDRKGYHWVYRGPHAGAGTQRLEFKFYYPMQDGFFIPGLAAQPAAGTALPYLRPLDAALQPVGDAVTGEAFVIKYQPVWPVCPELRVAETLTLPKFGLPAVRGQTSAEVLYQQSVARLGTTKPAATLHDPTRQKVIALDAASVGLSKLPGSAATTGSFGKIYFQFVPPHLQKRFYYDPLLGAKGSLVLKGEFIDEIAGEDYLNLNALSADDEARLKAVVISTDIDKDKWDAAIEALTTRVQTFIENTSRRGTYIVDTTKNVDVGRNGLAEITNSDTAVDSYALTATGKADGYVTLLLGDGEAFTPKGEPVSIKIIKVAPQLYTGDLKVLLSANPLDEQVTLRHSGDFAAKPEDYDFDWRYAPPGDGVAPTTYTNTLQTYFGDGLNATWQMIQNPSSASAAPSARIVRVTGGDPGEGLDLSGSFLYAVNVGPTAATGRAGDAFFTNDTTQGVVVTASQSLANYTSVELGSSTADNVLEDVYRSIRWNPAPGPLTVALSGVVPGRRYKLQLLFADAGADRVFDVSVEGKVVADDFSTRAAQGANVAADAGSALVYEFEAGDSTVNIVLDGSSVGRAGVDPNPMLNGLTLEETSGGVNSITLPRSLAIHDSSYNPAGNPPGVVLKNPVPVDFTTGVPEQIVFSAELPPLDGFVLFVNDIPALATNVTNPPVEAADSTSGLSPSGLRRQWSVSPNYFRKGLNSVSIALHTAADTGAQSRVDFKLEASVETDTVAAIGSPWLTPNGTLSNIAVVGGPVSSPLGSPLLAMSDNYFTMRYRAKTGVVAGQWSRWMPAKLVEGWIKRVLAGINPFNQRIKDLLNNPVNTDVSLLTQAGKRWEGDVALNLQNINDFGLIEIYETVLKRGKNMSIDSGYDYAPANDSLLLAAGYLNDLYGILGNEAFADAANPTISIDDQTTITEVNTSRFAFEGQVSSVLEEELGLLRGRDDFLNPGVTVAPAYNRLYWNYTRGINSGEALYAVNYNIKEKAGSPTANGNLDAADAQRMFPQGHGDAYGHYLTALKGYYYLLQNPHFTWTPRSEAVTVLGQAVQIDYFDERKFAAAAANAARSAAQIIALTHRQVYADTISSGWKNFRDGKANPRTGRVRQQGLDEWTSRATQGAFFNWVAGNAILPEKDSNPSHTGIQIIDRTTVPELADLVASAASFQNSIDNANAHLNPLGLTPDSIAFDISPSLLQQGHSHFDQVYDRALKAVLNAKGSFNQAAKMTRLLRNQENQIDDYNAAIVSQERAYVAQLQDIFGTPYTGDIGPGKTYVQDYNGPDLVNWFVVDRPTDLVDTTVPVDITVPVTTGFTGFTGKVSNPTSYMDNIRATLKDNTQVVMRTFKVQPNRFIQYSDLYRTGGMGQRSITGRLQQALVEAHHAQLEVLEIGHAMDTLNMRFRREHQLFTEMIAAQTKTVADTASTHRRIEEIERAIAGLNGTAGFMSAAAELADDITDGAVEGVPETLGTSWSIGWAGKPAVKIVGSLIAFSLQTASAAAQAAISAQEAEIGKKEFALDETLTALGFSQEAHQALYQYELLFDDMTSVSDQLATASVKLQQTSENVRNVLAEGQRVLDDREVFRQRAAAIVQGYRTRDLTFRTFRNEALEQYRTLFDLAGRYTYLATKSYDYETGLLGTPAGSSLLASIVASRSLGDLSGDTPQATTSTLGDSGLAGVMARLQSDWSVAKGRLGINNPDTYGTLFSLRGEAFRILNSPTTLRDDEEWKQTLEHHIVRDVMADADVGRYCSNIRKANGAAVPGIILPFATTISHAKNFFGLPLAAGDHAFSASSFATKIYGVGMCFPGYVGMDVTSGGTPYAAPPNSNSPLALSATPYVYLIPTGTDTMLAPPLGDTGQLREWNVNDQALPLPFNLGASSFSTTQFFTAQDTLTEQPWIPRKHQAFRVVNDPALFYSRMPDEFTCRRLVGRSAWNTQWKIVIPAYTLLANEQDGLNRFVASVQDIQLYLRTYSHAGN